MTITLKRRDGRVVPFSFTTQSTTTVCLWCCFVLLIFFTNAANAATGASGNSSGITSSDGQTGEDTTLTTMEKGMKPFFDMVKSFLGIVQPHKLTEQTWLNFSDIYVDGQFKTEQFTDWEDWATYLVGFLVCGAVGVIFFVVMPILGLVFCCCRCCGKCGGRPKPHDPKRAGCKRKSYCTLLLLFNTVTLAGVVCAFLSNELVYEKLRNVNDLGPVGKLTSTVDNIESYVNLTVDDIQKTVQVGFRQTKTQIIDDVRSTASDAVDAVLRSLNATALLEQTKDLSRVVNQTQDQLMNVADQLDTLSSNGTSLTNQLQVIANDIETLCTGTMYSCGNFDKNKYAVSANFTKLDRLGAEAANVAKSVDLARYIKEAEERIDKTKNDTTSSVDSGIKKAETSVEDVQGQIDNGVSEVRREVRNSVLRQTGELRIDLLKYQSDITQYAKYWWYGGLGVSGVLLLVVLLYYVGVLFGLCGERPGLGAQCCNTGTGSNFLMAGVAFTFLLAWLVMLVCILLFVVGGPIYTEVCRYVSDHDPQELRPFNEAVMQIVDLQKGIYDGKDVKLDLVTILNDCKRDSPIYQTLKLENMVNLTQYTDLTVLRDALQGLKSDNLTIPNVEIVNQKLNDSVNDFANAGLGSIPFQSYYDEVNKNLTAGNLNSLAENIRSIAGQATVPSDVKAQLKDHANTLDNLQTSLVRPMKDAVVSLNDSLRFLETQTEAQIKPATTKLLTGLQTAQDDFNAASQNLVKHQLDTVVDRVIGVAEGFISDILDRVNNQIGKCRPLYDGFYSATDSVCVVMLDPLNGFWFSIGWCLFFFVPSLIFAVKLAGLYRREHDEKEYDDPNYTFYGRHDQDTIPLTSRYEWN